MFAQRPSRLPRSNTQSSLGAQSRRSHQHQLDHPPFWLHRPRAHSSQGLRRSDTVRSSQTAYQYQPRSKRHRPRPGRHPYQYPGPQPGGHTTLHSHRSLASLRNATARANLHSPYPRSYHSASGPGSGRAASPALSNMYEYRLPARHMSRHSSFGTAPSSPGSTASVRPSLHDYRNEHNGSVTSFRRLPSPCLGPNRYQPPRHASFSRNLTPISAMRQPQHFGSTASLDSGAASPTDSVVPFYYDYSESFHGADGLIRSPADHPPIPEVSVDQEEDSEQNYSQYPQTRDPFSIMPSSRYSPAELPTKHNRRASEQSMRSRHSRKTSDKSNLSAHLSSQAIHEHLAHEHEPHIESNARATQVRRH